MTTQPTAVRGRRRRRRRQLLLLQTSGFGSPDDRWLDDKWLVDDAAAVLRASSLLDEHALRTSWRQGRDRLVAMAEFERRADLRPAPIKP